MRALRRHGLVPLVVLALWLPQAAGAADPVLDIVSVMERARQSDPQLGSVRREHEAVRLTLDEARAGVLPQFAFTAADMRTRQRVLSTENPVYQQGEASYPTRSDTWTLTVPLMRASAWRRMISVKASIRQSAYSLEAAELDLLTRASTAYIALLAARDAQGLARAERDAIGAQLSVVRARRQSGQVAQHVLSEVVARYEMRQADVLSAENEMRDRMLALGEIIGPMDLRQVQLPVLRDDAVLPRPDPQDPQTWVEKSLAQNSLLQAKRSAVELAKEEIERLRHQYLPTVDLVITDVRRGAGGSLYGGGSRIASRDYLLSMNYPIFEGGITRAQVAQAAHRHAAAELEMERVTRQVDHQARTFYQSILVGAQRERALRASVSAYREARTFRAASVRSGLLPVTALLDAERDLYGALRDLAQVRYDQLLNLIKLKQLVAALSLDDFQQIAGLFGAAPDAEAAPARP